MTEHGVVVKHTFLNLEESGDSQKVETQRCTRSLSDFGVEYGDQKADAKVDLSDDGSTTGDNTRRSTNTSTEGSADDASATQWQTPTVMGISTTATSTMFPMQMTGASMPGSFVAPLGAQMYLMSFAPNGTQVLIPFTSGMTTAQASMNTGAWMTGTSAALPHHNAVAEGSLEARAAALSAHAAEVRAAARRAKAAATAARRHSNSGDQEEICQATSRLHFDNMETASLAAGPRTASDNRTTLMLRNLPNNYTRTAVLEMLDSEGLAGTYCFVYVPTDFKNFTGFGYAFVGFCNHDDAARAKRQCQGFGRWRVQSQKTCDVAWSGPVQGLSQHTERYRNSPVMHPGVPDEYKPAVFVNGVRVPFPAPTKRIRPPRLRHSIVGEVLATGDVLSAGRAM